MENKNLGELTDEFASKKTPGARIMAAIERFGPSASRGELAEAATALTRLMAERDREPVEGKGAGVIPEIT